MDVYIVDAERDGSDLHEHAPHRMCYAAMAETPDAAIEAVRALVAPELELSFTGKTLSPVVAKAIGVRPGQARLV